MESSDAGKQATGAGWSGLWEGRSGTPELAQSRRWSGWRLHGVGLEIVDKRDVAKALPMG